MARIALNAEVRTPGSKSVMRALRGTSSVPGVVYHKGEKSLPIQLGARALFEVLHTGAGRNALIDLKVEGEKKAKPRLVVVKALQQHPVKGTVLHVDFHEVSLTEKIKVHVPIVEKGEAPGVKNDGGLLEIQLRELEVECLPTDIPEHIDIDISGLALNQSIHVSDLKLPANVKVLTDAEMVIVQVRLPEELVVGTPEGEEAKEPEVITEKKKEGEEGEAAAASGEKKPAEKAEKAEPKK